MEGKTACLLLLMVMLAGAGARAYGLDRPFWGAHSFNEAHYAMNAVNFFSYGIFQPMDEAGLDYMKGILTPWAVFASFAVFGVSEFAARLPNFAFGMVSILLAYLIAREIFSREVGLLAALSAALAPGIVYFSTCLQLESLLAMLVLASFLFMLWYKREGRTKWLMASVGMLLLATLAKNTAPVVLPALFLLFMFYRKPTVRSEFVAGTAGLLLPAIVAVVWIWVVNLSGLNRDYLYYDYSWSPQLVALAFAKNAVFLPSALGIPVFLLALAGACAEWIKGRADRVALASLALFAMGFYSSLLVAPGLHSGNSYYDYPAWYVFCMFAGVGCAWMFGMAKKWRGTAARNALVAPLVASLALSLLLCLSLYFGGGPPGAGTVVSSSKLVKELNSAHEPVLVDDPVPMYYAGADPMYITWTARGTVKMAMEAGAGRYSYVVLSYQCMNKTAVTYVESAGYVAIAECAWRKVR